jgi:alpha-tubulin suppressor-like RCC1 family protein
VLELGAGNSSGHTCAIVSTGALRCWGWGGAKLGYPEYYDDDIGDDETPVQVGDVDLDGHVISVVAGASVTCALLDTHGLRCWGSNTWGMLGYPGTAAIGDNEPPLDQDVQLGGLVTQVAAGNAHTCAALDDGRLRCWGLGDSGQLGYGNQHEIGDDETPAEAGDVNVAGFVTQVAAGVYHSCALLGDGSVRCWGDNDNGQLGYGNTVDVGWANVPADVGVVDVGGEVVQIVAGTHHTCAVLIDGGLRCWGNNGSGQLGYGHAHTVGDDETPAAAGDVPCLLP